MKKAAVWLTLLMLLAFVVIPIGLSAPEEFVIQDGVLIAYNGKAKDVVIPEGVTAVGEDAFFKSEGKFTNVKTISLPNSLANFLGWYVITCANLQEYRVNSDNPYFTVQDGILFNKDMTQLISFPFGLKKKSYTVPEGVTSIAENGLTAVMLTSVILPESLVSIGDDGFTLSKALKSVNLPQGLTDIGLRAFNGCDGVTEITIPAGVQTIGDGACSGMLKLKAIHVDEANQRFYIDDGALVERETGRLISYPSADKRTEFVIPDGIVTVGNYAFKHADKLKKITVPGSVTDIGISAFGNCKLLAEIVLSKGLKNIGNKAFYICPKMKDLVIPDGVVTLGSDLFYGSTAVNSVTIPPSVTNISDNNFSKAVLRVVENSYAYLYALENAFRFELYQPSGD